MNSTSYFKYCSCDVLSIKSLIYFLGNTTTFLGLYPTFKHAFNLKYFIIYFISVKAPIKTRNIWIKMFHFNVL